MLFLFQEFRSFQRRRGQSADGLKMLEIGLGVSALFGGSEIDNADDILAYRQGDAQSRTLVLKNSFPAAFFRRPLKGGSLGTEDLLDERFLNLEKVRDGKDGGVFALHMDGALPVRKEHTVSNVLRCSGLFF